MSFHSCGRRRVAIALVLVCLAPVRARAALGAITGVERQGDTLTLSVGADTLIVQVCRTNLLRVNFLPGGSQSPDTAVIGTTNWPAVGATISTNSDPIVLSTDALQARIARNPCRLSLYDAAGATLLLRERADEGVFTDGIRLERAAVSDLYGVNGFNSWEDSSAGMLRNSGGWVEAGYQGDCGAPLIWSRDGYGLVVDSDGGQFTVDGTNLTFEFCSKTDIEYYLAAGPPGAILSAVAALSGAAPMFPKWAMGFANTEWGITQSELTNAVNTYRTKQIPIDHYILDFDWKAWGEDDYGEWRWNTANFPGGPSGSLRAQMEARGIRLSGIMKPRIHVDTVQGGYATTNGFWWPGSSPYVDYFDTQWVNDVDFSIPACRAWYWDHITNAFRTGITGWWNDEADEKGGGGGLFDNWQFMNMQKALYDGQRGWATQRVWSINRNFYLGAQRYAYALWSGDIDTGFAAMAEQRERMLSAINLGQARWGMDIGGFNGTPSSENYARWVQFGAFVPVFRVHGSQGAQRQPWVYGATAEAAAKAAIELRYRLLPYVYSYERQLAETGVGLVRPLFHAYPADPNAANYVDAWMFGDYLLAAPVLTEGQTSKSIYLPAGTWYDYLRGARYNGGQTLAYAVNSTTWTDLPLFVRQGAIIPTQPVMNFAGETPATNVFLDVFPDASPVSFAFYDDDGTTYGCEQNAFFRQAMETRDFDEAVTLDLFAPTGAYAPEAQYYICMIHCLTGASVTINQVPATQYAGFGELDAAPGEGWAEGADRFGYAVRVKVVAGQARSIVVSNDVVATPVFDPGGGVFTEPVLVTITCRTAGAVVRFTADGSDPDETSTPYADPIPVSTTTTIRARAYKTGREPSAIAEAVFVQDENLLRNPGFELVGTTTNEALYWNFNNPDVHGDYWGSARRVPWRSHSGAWEGTVRGTWAGAGDEGGFWQEAAVVTGRAYRFSAWLWADSNWAPGLQGMKLEFWAGAQMGVDLVYAVTNFLADIGPQWVSRSIQAVAPAGADWVRVVVFAQNVSANGALQFDDLHLDLLPYLPPPAVTAIAPSSPTSFVLRWADVAGADGYVLDVATNPAFRAPVLASDLFISEYAEGTGNNKYIEVFNGTGQTKDLSQYRVLGISGGGSWYESSVALSNTLADGGVQVIRNAACTTAVIIAAADQVAANAPPMNFNGDDAVGLGRVADGVTSLMDAVGAAGSDPGSGWGVAGTANGTQNHTLVRKSAVISGNTDWLSCSNEWTVYPVDAWTFLGSHAMDRGPDDHAAGYRSRALGDVTNIEATGLTAGVTYYVRLTSTNGNGNSAYSLAHTVTTYQATYSILAVAGPNGSIHPAGVVVVPFSASTDFIVSADAYYHIEAVLTNGGPVAGVAGWSACTATWSAVTATGMIQAGFAPDRATNHGTPHWWLARHVLTNAITGFDDAELADVDVDRAPAWAEYGADTDPTNAGSVFTLSARWSATPGRFLVEWPGSTNREYDIGRSTDLPLGFEVLSSNLPGVVPVNVYTDDVNVAVSSVFYRVRAVAP